MQFRLQFQTISHKFSQITQHPGWKEQEKFINTSEILNDNINKPSFCIRSISWTMSWNEGRCFGSTAQQFSIRPRKSFGQDDGMAKRYRYFKKLMENNMSNLNKGDNIVTLNRCGFMVQKRKPLVFMKAKKTTALTKSWVYFISPPPTNCTLQVLEFIDKI